MAINLGDINFSLGADHKALDASIRKLQQFGRVVDDAANAQVAGATKVETALRRQEAAMVRAVQRVQVLNDSLRKADSGGENFSRNKRALDGYINTLTNSSVSALTFQRANEKLSTSLARSNKALKDLRAAQAAEELSKLNMLMHNLSAASVLVAGPLSGITSRITAFTNVLSHNNFATAAFVAGMAVAAYAAYELGGAMVRIERQFQSTQNALGAVFGSLALGERAFGNVAQIADRAGQPIQNLTRSYGSFMAAANGTAMAGNRANELFTTMALVTGKLQLPAERAEGALKALEQMMSKGTVQAEELRGQLGDQLPGAFGIAARAMKVSTKELGEMLKKGQVLSSDFLPKFEAQLRKEYNIGASTSIDNLNASFNKLGNAWQIFLNKLDHSLGVSSTFKNILDALTGTLQFLGKNLVDVGKWAAVAAGAIAGIVSTTILTGMVNLALNLGRLTKAMLVFNVAAMSNPIGGLVMLFVRLATAILGATAAYSIANNLMNATSKSAASLGDEVNELVGHAKEFGNGIGPLGESLKVELKERIEQTDEAIKNLSGTMDAFQTAKRSWSFSLDNGIQSNVTGSGVSGKMEELLAERFRLQESLDRLNNAPKENKYKDNIVIDATKLRVQKEHLEAVTNALTRAHGQLEALTTGGTEGLARFDKAMDVKDKVLAFEKQCRLAGKSEQEAAAMTDEYRKSLERLDPLLVAVKKSEEAASMLRDSLGNSFEGIGKALTSMVAKGKMDLKSLASATQAAVNDILDTLIKLSVTNPLKNWLFGLTGSQASPTLGGLGGIGGGSGIGGLFKSLFGLGGGLSGDISASIANNPTIFKHGGVFDYQGARKLGMGGLLSSPTMFGTMSGPVLGGEAGTEAILPLRRTATGELGVHAGGHGGGGSVVNVTIQTPNPQAFKQSSAQVATTIRRAVVQAGKWM